MSDTSALSATLKQRVKALERQGGSGRDGQIRKQQTALVKSKFVEAIQNYQSVEQQYRTKYKQRMERQFKIGLSSLLLVFCDMHLTKRQSNPTRPRMKSGLL
jgi:t-SNARE complex subunit (syntaxin)